MTNNWNDFNSAEEQNNFDVMPKGTLVKVRMTIKPGGYDDANNGWAGGYATWNKDTGAVYLSCEFVILAGEFAKRKVWSNIGLYSQKNNNNWGNMGRSFIRGILNSARGIMPKDESPNAQAARRINSLADLDGIEFVASLGVGKDQSGGDKNEIQLAITPDHKDYAAIMGAVAAVSAPTTAAAPPSSNYQPSPPAAAPTSPPAAPAGNSTGKPSWAQ